jgi:predicted HAD superfamily Cof-like phosphohydrolase
MSYERDIQAFHERFKLEYNGKPRAIGKELAKFRAMFLFEELVEYINASSTKPLDAVELEPLREVLLDPLENYNENPSTEELEHQFDALIDLLYVLHGTSYLHGFPMAKGWDRVHAVNMQKVRAERAEDSKRGSTFDVTKPPGWQPASLLDLLD